MTEIYKKKFIWEVTALNENQEELYKGFCKVSARPTLLIEEVEIANHFIPGKDEWNTVHITMPEYNESMAKLPQTKYIRLKLLSGCYEPLEEWISGEGETQTKRIKESLEVAFLCKDWSYKNPVKV